MDKKNDEIKAESILGLLKMKRTVSNRLSRSKNYKYKSQYQLRVLYRVYNVTPYPSSETRNDLGILLNMHPRSVQIWFQNTRQNSKDGSGSIEFKQSGGQKSKEKDISATQLVDFCIETNNQENSNQ